MDVGEEEMAEVAQRDSSTGETRCEGFQAGGRPTVDEGRLVARQEVRRYDPGMPQVEEVEWLDRSTT
jgi:hypothetical protein